MLLVGHGLSCHHVEEYFGGNTVTIQRWVRRFNKSGFAVLAVGERPGRPSCLSGPQWSRLEKDLRQAPRDLGYAQNLWDGKIVAHHLEMCYRVTLDVRHCQRLFRRLGIPLPQTASVDRKSRLAGAERFGDAIIDADVEAAFDCGKSVSRDINTVAGVVQHRLIFNNEDSHHQL